ncbi:MAG: class I SAM-dependent methyltransferase [Planctomycetaceae bacterium]|jgi:16S rRNA G966 N2-methylase RsmD|nr:class I SAM-dependent methyltransferase [Planctomycetaceae bacterium]
MNRILYYFSCLPSRIYWKVKGTILRWRGCDFADFRDPSFGFDVGYQYRSTPVRDFRRLMKRVDREFLPFEQMAFFDAGFGKGAILIEGMKLGIPQVGGVELSESMFAVCNRNLEILGRKKENTKLYQANAATLTTQLDDFNLFYMSNPFPEHVVKQFALSIIDSTKRKPRKFFIVYFHATLHQTLIDTGFKLEYNQTRKILFKPEIITYNKIYSLPNQNTNTGIEL